MCLAAALLEDGFRAGVTKIPSQWETGNGDPKVPTGSQGVIQRVLNAGNSAKPVWKVLELSIVCDIDLVAIVRDKQQWLKNKQVQPL